MSESKILTALAAFKDKYGWDKSLIGPNMPVSSFVGLDVSCQMSDGGGQYLLEFMRQERERAGLAELERAPGVGESSPRNRGL